MVLVWTIYYDINLGGSVSVLTGGSRVVCIYMRAICISYERGKLVYFMFTTCGIEIGMTGQ